MSESMADAVARVLAEHSGFVDHRNRLGCMGCLFEGDANFRRFATANEYTAHVAELIAREFLVVPRSETTMEFGISDSPAHRIESVGVRTEAMHAARLRRAFGLAQAQAYERALLPWSPIPLGDVPDAS